jgi:hypothetical protein
MIYWLQDCIYVKFKSTVFGMIQLWLWNSLDPYYAQFFNILRIKFLPPSPSNKPQDRRASRHRIHVWWQNDSFHMLMLNLFQLPSLHVTLHAIKQIFCGQNLRISYFYQTGQWISNAWDFCLGDNLIQISTGWSSVLAKIFHCFSQSH